MRNLRSWNQRTLFLFIFLSVFILISRCQNVEKSADIGQEKEIISQLMEIKGKGILFGHQDDLAYGIDWSYIDGESDVKRVSGDYPALFGWELGGIEEGRAVNLDSVPFDAMRELVIWGFECGGINTFSWHPFSAVNGENSWNTETIVVNKILPGGSHHDQFMIHLDKLGNFFQSLTSEYGEVIPFIFRPWHEMDGSWFWWGSKSCTNEEFKELFRFTVEYLRKEKGLDEMLIAYSPDRNFTSIKEYLTWYPGDDVVDIIGMDNYHDFKLPNGIETIIKKLHMLIDFSEKKNKLVAFTETGLENVTDSLWFTQQLGKVLEDPTIMKNISYAMVWRSDPKVHFFFPYPGHPAADDANAFLSQKGILLLNDFNELK